LVSFKESVEEARPEIENAPEVATQPKVEEVPEGHHPEDGNPNASSMHHRIGRSERPNSIVMGNHDEWEDDHEEIATNYVKSGESYYIKTTVVDTYFASKLLAQWIRIQTKVHSRVPEALGLGQMESRN